MFKLFSGSVTEFEVIKTSDKSVWFKRKTNQGVIVDNRELLKTSYYSWFDSRQDAIDALYKGLSSKVPSAKYGLDYAEKELEKAVKEFG
jgi:hypothetical protein